MKISWKRVELVFLVLYALTFYAIIIQRSLQLSRDNFWGLHGLRQGWIADRLNDVSDSQWRNFRGNLPILTAVFGIFVLVANTLRMQFHLNRRGMSIVWLSISLIYLSYLHGACVIFVLLIASMNFILVKIFALSKYFSVALWVFNIFFLMCNRVYEGYSFSNIGQCVAFLDNYRGSFRWHICFNFGIFLNLLVFLHVWAFI
ncbi:hypothetical protein GIB67_035204 [Kingdonia uniflora]|uniref:Uncharacterized protein n=1 Tax=Kingdonia uniflora TaxID=39325 RepID=A0A7J7KXQ3_9MAGN|nr:hypothetical protein GIB67_035204 [Kingdonia uniflora]